VATDFRDGLVLWHAIITSKADEQNSYFDPRIDKSIIKKDIITPLSQGIENARHIIGWCSQATDFCGKSGAETKMPSRRQ
jgi:hypothetical protein